MQPFQDRNVMNSSVPDYKVSQTKSQTFDDKGKPQRKRRKLPISEIRLMDASTDTEITMVDQACQTDLPFVVPSPHTFKSIPLADVRHAVANDHSYATLSSDSPVVPAEKVPGPFLAKIFQNPRGRWISPKWTHRIFLKLTAKQRKLKMSGFHPTSQIMKNRTCRT